jgi:hypothetical protein
MTEFYVYALVDPRTDQPFYIGKGKGRRVLAHEREARNGVTSAKACRIRDIWCAGLEVERRIVADGLDDAAACQLEREMIERDRASLTNVSPGGGPASVDPDQVRRREAFQSWCRQVLDEVAIPTLIRHIDTYGDLDTNDRKLRQCINLLWQANVREFTWHGSLVRLSL